jgi:regulator of ribonuclease activity A
LASRHFTVNGVCCGDVRRFLSKAYDGGSASAFWFQRGSMTASLPDICDQFIDEIMVFDPVFKDFGGKRRFCGEIMTLRCFEDNSRLAETVRSPGRGRVLVVDGGGSLRRALLGDMLALAAVQNGWQGLVINGAVRDVEILETIDLGIKALAACPVRTDKRGEGQLDVPLRFAGAQLEPGQFLYADANGIIVARRMLGVDF